MNYHRYQPLAAVNDSCKICGSGVNVPEHQQFTAAQPIDNRLLYADEQEWTALEEAAQAAEKENQ